MKNGKKSVETKIEPKKMFDHEKDASNWNCFNKGGVEFPVVDFSETFGKPYDHYWACGFGSVMQDRFLKVLNFLCLKVANEKKNVHRLKKRVCAKTAGSEKNKMAISPSTHNPRT